MSTAPKPDLLALWSEYSSKLPEGIPDEAYNAQRKAFIEKTVRPYALSQGLNLPALEEEFMRKSERPGKSPAPRAALAGISAVRTALDPVLGAIDAREAQRALEGHEKAAVLEAQRQGVGTALPQLAGSVVGSLPYFIPNLGVTNSIAAISRISQTVKQVANAAAFISAGAASEAMMEGLRAEEGQRLPAALRGAAIGGGATAALYGTGLGVGKLLARKGIQGDAADAVTASLTGTPTAQQEAVAQRLIEKDPTIIPDIMKEVADNLEKIKASGVPKKRPVVRAGKTTITLEDGSPPIELPAGGPELDKRLEAALAILRPKTRKKKLAEHFDKVKKVDAIEGEPTGVHKVLKALDRDNAASGAYDTPVVLKGSKVELDETVPFEVPSAAAPPAPPAGVVHPPTTPAGSLSVDEFTPRTNEERLAFARWKKNEITDEEFGEIIKSNDVLLGEAPVEKAKRKRKPKSAPAPKITLDEVPDYDFLQTTADGKILDTRTGMTHDTIKEALAASPRYAAGQAETLADGSSIVERPLHNRITEDPELPPGTSAATQAPEGAKPLISYRQKPGEITPSLAYHEGLHSHIGYLGLRGVFQESDEMFPKLWSAFDPEVRSTYLRTSPDSMNEEVFTWLSQAVRHGEDSRIQAFADADGGRETLLNWYSDTVGKMQAELASKPDSLHKSVLDRKLADLQRRTTRSLDDITRTTTDPLGDRLSLLDDGRYAVDRTDGTRMVLPDRPALADFLEKEYATPINAPDLVDTSLLPEGLPRFAIEGKAKPPSSAPPIHTTPPTPEVFGPIKAGAELFSWMFRPFYSWVDTVASKHRLPEIAQAMKLIQRAEVAMQSFSDPFKRALMSSIGKYHRSRRQDLYRYVAATSDTERQMVAKELRLTQQEIKDLDTLEKRFFDPLTGVLGIDGRKFIREFQPEWRDDSFSLDKLGRSKSDAPTSDFEFFSNAVRNGEIDPRDTDLLRVAHEYLRLGARKRFLETPINAASQLVNLKNEAGEYLLGNLQPLFKRHLEYMRGVPDFTARVTHAVFDSAVETINSGISKINKALPARMQIEPIEISAQEALNKWISYSYAGALMLRPMVHIRDSMQILMTTYPILGGKYMNAGMQKAFPVLRKGGIDSEAYQIPLKYGALMRHNDLLRFLEGSEKVNINRFVENAMRPLEWTNNSNRLVAFWGHALKIQEALRQGVDSSFVTRSDLGFLDKHTREAFLAEARSLDPTRFADFSYRAAKELVDFSQWNYSRGAAPGLYKFALGRVFGQYGTWPLNYIEYARRLTIADGVPRSLKVAALTRLALAHGAIMKAGEAFGVDTGSWVFTNPMAYGGGPLFQAMVSVPGSFDFETPRGNEARRNVIRPFFPMGIPGGLAAENVWKAINEQNGDTWKTLLGFHELSKSEAESGMHLLIP
jgi:hypothetical protein